MVDNQQDQSTDSIINDTQSDQNHQSIENDDEFLRITAAHQILIEAQTYEEQQNYPMTLQLYRICLDFLLEELMFAEGTDQSRLYLREKCTAIMDRIDLLKTKLQPIPLSSSITIEQSSAHPAIAQLDSLHLS